MFRSVLIVLALLAQPAFANVIWRGDFSTGNTSQWTSKEVAAADRVQVVTSPVPPDMRYSMQATVKPGDLVYNGARAELDYETDRPKEGDERYYRWETYFPSDFKSADYWQLFTQWHQYISGGSPPLAFMAWGEKIQVGNDQGIYFWNAPLVRGVWHEFVFRVLWSSDSTKGRIELWYDGEHVLGPTAVRTLFAGDTVYLKQGLYRKSAIDWTQVVYTAGTVIGTTYADVKPSAALSATVSPTNLSFGSVRLGSTATQQTVTVKNTGTSSLSLGGYTLTGGSSGFSVSPAGASTTIAAGQSASWTVTYNPTAVGSASGSLTFTSGSASLSAGLSGTCVFPKTSVSPTSLGFGTVAPGITSPAKTVTISNTGTDSLTISGLALSGANASDFAFTQPSSLTVAAGKSATLNATFRPGSDGAKTATLTFSTDNGAQSVSLSGTGGSSAAGTVSPTSVAFGSFRVGSDPTATVTVSNTGGAALTVSQYALSGTNANAFSVTPGSASTTIAAGASSTWTVKAMATAAGSISATLTFSTSAGNLQVALSGKATAPKGQLSKTSLAFGQIRVGSSAQQSFELSNVGTATLNVSALSISGTNAADFSAGSTAPFTIAVGAAKTIPVSFKPGGSGSRTGLLTLTTDDGAKTVTLGGTGVTQVLTSSPAQIDFGAQGVGKSTTTKTVTIQNGTSQTLNLTAFTFGGENAGDFSLATTARAQSMAANGTLALTVAFSPSAMGARSGTLTVATDDPTLTLAIPLTGTGISPVMQVEPAVVAFGQVPTGTSERRTIRVTNAGTSELQIQSGTIVGPGAGDFALAQPLTSVVRVAAGSSFTLDVRYAPATARSSVATLVLTTDDPAQPVASLSLTGEATAPSFSLSTTTVGFGAVRVGQASDELTLTVTNTGNGSGSLGVSLGGDDAQDFSVSGATEGHVTLAAGGSTALGIVFVPMTHGDRTATVTLTDASGSNTLVVTLSGTGIEPGLNASPATVSFDPVLVGSESVTQTVTVTNGGTAPLHLAEPAIESPNALFTVDAPTRTVDVGSSVSLTVTFNPTTAGTFQGVLHLSSADTGVLTADVVLTATAIAPGLSLPTAVEFDTTPVQGSSEKTITLTNLDSTPLTISKVTVDASDYAVTATLPATLEQSSSLPMTVAFTPQTAGLRPGQLSVFAAGRADPIAVIALSGVGAGPTPEPKTARRAGCSSTDASSLAALGALLAFATGMRRRRAA